MTEEAARLPNTIHTKAMCLFSRDGKTLASRGFDSAKNEEFFRVIGGGVHFTEKAEEAVRREVREELGAEISKLRFLEVVENVFTYLGNPGHEIIFLYEGEFADASIYEQESVKFFDGKEMEAVWIPISDVLAGTKKLYPAVDFSKYLR
jgi:ADP-ribose pyrophosphatase YjhB (NUDIX family)